MAKFVAKTSSMTFNSFVRLDFSCNRTSFGGLTEQSSGLTSERTASQSSGSNFQWSNWQKVQFNTDLFKWKHSYLYRKDKRWLNR